MDIVNLLNVSIHNTSMNKLLEDLNKTGGVVVTPNLDHLVKLQYDRELLKAYYQSTYRVCDSKILQKVAGFLGNPIQEKISGSDLFPAFYEYNKDNEDVKIFLLGAKEGVAKKAQEKINKKVGRNIVVEALSPSFGFEKDEAECQKIVEIINNSEATVLAIGVGAPKQEKWITKYKSQLKKIKIFLAIGATIDFEAGNIDRAPQWMSENGLEWFYRLQSEPKRLWKRYLVESLPFFLLISQQKINRYNFSYADRVKYLPLGEKLSDAGLLSPELIRETLLIQKENKGYRFGDIVVDRGYINRQTVNFFDEELPQLLEANKYRKKLRLGDYLNKAGLLDLEQINETLYQQSLNRQKFGEIITQKGWVQPKTLDWFVGLQNY